MMEPAPARREPDGAFSGRLSGTRRNFIRGVAAAGATTALATTLERAGQLDLFAATAEAAEPTALLAVRGARRLRATTPSRSPPATAPTS